MIDIRHCCIDGLCICLLRYDGQHDPSSIKAQQKLEQQHMNTCPECNPALLATELFGRPIEIGEELK